MPVTEERSGETMEPPETMEPSQEDVQLLGEVKFCFDESYIIHADHSLKLIHLRDYILVLKNDFDLLIAGEPYHALTLLLNKRSGVFLERIWNKTVSTGRVTSQEEFEKVCIRHFRDRRLCLGVFEDEEEQVST